MTHVVANCWGAALCRMLTWLRARVQISCQLWHKIYLSHIETIDVCHITGRYPPLVLMLRLFPLLDIGPKERKGGIDAFITQWYDGPPWRIWWGWGGLTVSSIGRKWFYGVNIHLLRNNKQFLDPIWMFLFIYAYFDFFRPYFFKLGRHRVLAD